MVSDFGEDIKDMVNESLSSVLSKKSTSGLGSEIFDEITSKLQRALEKRNEDGLGRIMDSLVLDGKFDHTRLPLEAFDKASYDFSKALSTKIVTKFKDAVSKFKFSGGDDVSKIINTTSNEFGAKMGSLAARELSSTITNLTGITE